MKPSLLLGLRLLVVVVLVLLTSSTSRAQCGNLPCFSILADPKQTCPGHGINPVVTLVSHLNRAAVVDVLVTTAYPTKTVTGIRSVNIGPNGIVTLGCSGNTETGEHVTYQVKSYK
jgi:hypothetical protein